MEQQEIQNGQHETLDEEISSRFQILNKIGSGAYGHVWKVKDRQTKQLFAIKKVFLAFQNETDSQRIYRQIAILRSLKHDNVVKLKEIVIIKNSIDIYLIFQLLESDLFNAIKDRILNNTHKKYIVYQLAKSLVYMHSAGILHRDIKPSNILLNQKCEIKICDFGLSRTLSSTHFKQAVLTEFIATRWYRSPQVLFGSHSYGNKSDMWSLGCLIYQLYTRRTLLPGKDTVQQILKLLEFKGMPNEIEKKSFQTNNIDKILHYFQFSKNPLNFYFQFIENQQIKTILLHLLEYDQQKRWSAKQLLDCDFLREFREFEDENLSKKPIQLDLNDNAQFSSDKYQSAIRKMTVQMQPKEDRNMKINLLLTSKRQNQHRSLHFNRDHSKEAKQLKIKIKPNHNSLHQKARSSLHSICNFKPKMQKRYQDVSNIYSNGNLKFSERAKNVVVKRNQSHQNQTSGRKAYYISTNVSPHKYPKQTPISKSKENMLRNNRTMKLKRNPSKIFKESC